MTNQETVEEYVRAFNADDLEALGKVFAPDALIHRALGWSGLAQVMPIWAQLHRSLR